jgi:hypothetical protein
LARIGWRFGSSEGQINGSVYWFHQSALKSITVKFYRDFFSDDNSFRFFITAAICPASNPQITLHFTHAGAQRQGLTKSQVVVAF